MWFISRQIRRKTKDLYNVNIYIYVKTWQIALDFINDDFK